MPKRAHQISMKHQLTERTLELTAHTYDDWVQVNNIWNGDEVVPMSTTAAPDDVIVSYTVQHIFIDPRERTAILYVIPA